MHRQCAARLVLAPDHHGQIFPVIDPVVAFVAQHAQAISLSFVEPNGVVGPSDDIPIVVRISNNTDNDFGFQGGDPANNYNLPNIEVPASGLNGNNMEAGFNAPPTASLNFSFVCSGSFTAGGNPAGACSPGDFYEFNFNNTVSPFFVTRVTLRARSLKPFSLFIAAFAAGN